MRLLGWDKQINLNKNSTKKKREKEVVNDKDFIIQILRFGLVSLFNGISAFVGYLMQKPFSEKNYLTHSWENKGIHTFPKSICPKVNVIARLEYELAYYDSAVHRFNHYATRTLTSNLEFLKSQCFMFKSSYVREKINEFIDSAKSVKICSRIYKDNMYSKMYLSVPV